MKPQTSRRSVGLVGVGLLLGTALTGCGRESPVGTDDPRSYATVAIDLSALHRPPGRGMQETCVSLAAEVALRVTPERGEVQNFSRGIPAEASTIRFDSIAVTEGSVAFSVSITSDNGTLLYGNESTEQIRPPTFAVDLTLAKLAPVLQVCPGHIVLDRSNQFSAAIQVWNRGIGTLAYEAVGPVCAGVPCLGIQGQVGTAEPGQVSQVLTSLPRMTTQTELEVRVQSPAGSVPLTVTLGQLPDLVVDTLRATDTLSFTKEGPQQPVRVVIRNVGNAPAGISKVAAEYTDSSDTFAVAFLVPGRADTFYPFTEAPLAPGGQVTFDGVIRFVSFPGGTPVLLRVEADSCSGEEDIVAPPCRVDEFDEGNNVSGDLSINFR